MKKHGLEIPRTGIRKNFRDVAKKAKKENDQELTSPDLQQRLLNLCGTPSHKLELLDFLVENMHVCKVILPIRWPAKSADDMDRRLYTLRELIARHRLSQTAAEEMAAAS